MPSNASRAIVDFGDMAHSALICDFVSTVEALMGERPDHFESLESTAAGYASITPFLDDEIAVLPDMLLTRWATTAVISAWRVRSYPENAEYITGWDAGVWAMLDAYRDIGVGRVPTEDPRSDVRRDPGRPPAAPRERLVRRAGGTPRTSCSARRSHRSRTTGRCISSEGAARGCTTPTGVRTWTATTTSPSSGHAHPRVVEAIARQAATLNTNARYLYGPRWSSRSG